MARTYIISEICGDWSLHIKGPGTSNNFLFFKSRNNAELVKSILEWEDAHPNKAVPYKPTLTPPNEWVSVEERLPEAEKEVRLFCITSNGYKYQCQGIYVPPGMHRDDSDYSWDWECCDQYDEDTDDYFVNPGWYEISHNWDGYSAFGVADKVTHWMPLPAPPDRRPPEEEI